MDAELNERVLECLRGLEIGESISADGIADEIGGKLSDVYDALEDLENAKLVEMHPACRKGSDPTYTLTPKGKHHAPLKAMVVPEPVEEDRCAPEVRPSADRMCRFCKREMEPNKVRRHERFCKANPDRDMPGRTPKEHPVPAPSEYAEDDSNAENTIEHEAPAEPEFPEVLDQLNAEDPNVPDEVPDTPAERVVRLVPTEAMVLKGSPGMAAVLRIISECQKAIADGADVHLNASIKVMPGLDVSVYLDTPVKESEQCQQ